MGTMFTLEYSTLFAARNSFISSTLDAPTPTFLPTSCWGVVRGALASDMMHAGLFWKTEPTMTMSAPWALAAAEVGGSTTPTRAALDCRTGMTDTLGPPV